MSQATTFGRREAVRAPTPPARPSSQVSQAPTPKPKVDPTSEDASVAGYFVWLLFSFTGRLSRTNYRYCRIAANLLFLFAIYGLSRAMSQSTGNLGAQALLALITLGLSMLMIWTTLAMQVKRRHDRDKAWPWLFVGFIPIIGPFWVLIETCWLDGTSGYNRFDDAASNFS